MCLCIQSKLAYFPIRQSPLVSNTLGVPPYLSGFVSAFNLATPGLSPMPTIYALINLYLNCVMRKSRN